MNREVEKTQPVETSPPVEVGVGDVVPSGMHPTDEAKLVSRAVSEQWAGKRWPTSVMISQLVKDTAERGDMTPIEKTMLTVVKLMDGNERAQGIAARTIVAMEAQNQTDEHLAEDAERRREAHDAMTVNVSVSTGVHVAMERVRSLPQEELFKLAAAAKTIRKLRESQQSQVE